MMAPLSRAKFVARYKTLFEHSPWVVERAAERQPFDDLHAGLMQVVEDASDEERLALIRAHPELAGKAAIAGDLTEESKAEQASAGLDRLTPEEFAEFHKLNSRYTEHFGFPFIICVRWTNKEGILREMRRRLGNDRAGEIDTAMAEIGRIVALRLEDMP